MLELASARGILLPKVIEKNLSYASRLSATAITVLATTIFALIPLFVNPFNAAQFAYQHFWPPKLLLLLGLSALLLAVVLAATLSRARFRWVPMLLPAAAFLAISTLSTAFSEDVYLSLVGLTGYYDGLLSVAAGVLLFYASARFLDSRAKVRSFLATGVASATIIAAYGISQRFGFDPLSGLAAAWPTDYGSRVFSTIGNPIYLAAYLTLMMGGAAALYFEAVLKWERVLWLSALAVIGACWFYTYTRGTVLGVGIALPVVLWFAHRRMGSARPLLVPLGSLAAAVLTAALLGWYADERPSQSQGAPTQEAGTLSPAPGVPSRLAQTQDANMVSRLLIWRDTVPVILERPLLGHGLDNFPEPFSRYEGEDLRAMMEAAQPVLVVKAQNELLQVLATTGALGLAAYVWIFFAYFRNAYRCGGWALIALSGGMLAYILQLQTIFTTLTTSVTFWAVLGVSAAVMRLPDRSGRGGVQPE